MKPAAFDDVESRPQGTGRVYRVDERTELAAFPVDGVFTEAPDGALAYVWLHAGRAGAWDWTDDPAAIARIIRAYRRATDPAYHPPDRRAPDGSFPMIRPTHENLVRRAMDEARPGRLQRSLSALPRGLDFPIGLTDGPSTS